MAARLRILLFCLPLIAAAVNLRVIVRDPLGARVPSADVIVLTAQRSEAAKGHSDT